MRRPSAHGRSFDSKICHVDLDTQIAPATWLADSDSLGHLDDMPSHSLQWPESHGPVDSPLLPAGGWAAWAADGWKRSPTPKFFDRFRLRTRWPMQIVCSTWRATRCIFHDIKRRQSPQRSAVLHVIEPLKKCLSLYQIRRVETLRKPTVDFVQ